jgi:hypothetical protein
MANERNVRTAYLLPLPSHGTVFEGYGGRTGKAIIGKY